MAHAAADVCDRGKIGEGIARAVNKDYSDVTPEDLATLQELYLNDNPITEISASTTGLGTNVEVRGVNVVD